MAKVSVIVPVYNTEKHLHRCVDSLIKQTLSDIEIILVDDGSTDKSGIICDDYAAQDARVHVIHQQNGGVSSARNTGLAAASGEFIGFVDSDDWVELEMYESLYNAMENTDIVLCDALTVYDTGKTVKDTIPLLEKSCQLTPQTISSEVLMQIAGSACRCLYRASNIKTLAFPMGLKLSEDRVFNLYAMGTARTIRYEKKAYYNRFVRKGSAVNRYYNDMLETVHRTREETMRALDIAWDGRVDFKQAYERQTVGQALCAVYNEFHKDAGTSLKSKLAQIQKIVNDQVVARAVETVQPQDLRGKWLQNKNIWLLAVAAQLYQIKNR